MMRPITKLSVIWNYYLPNMFDILTFTSYLIGVLKSLKFDTFQLFDQQADPDGSEFLAGQNPIQ